MGAWVRAGDEAIALNPGHAQWYSDSVIYYCYQTRDYERAWLEARIRSRSRDDVWWFLFRAMILGQLDRSNEAKPLIDAAVRLKPDVHERLRDMARIWHVPDPHIEHIARATQGRPRYRACATVFVTSRSRRHFAGLRR